jgi:hypothetical protein
VGTERSPLSGDSVLGGRNEAAFESFGGYETAVSFVHIHGASNLRGKNVGSTTDWLHNIEQWKTIKVEGNTYNHH